MNITFELKPTSALAPTSCRKRLWAEIMKNCSSPVNSPVINSYIIVLELGWQNDDMCNCNFSE